MKRTLVAIAMAAAMISTAVPFSAFAESAEQKTGITWEDTRPVVTVAGGELRGFMQNGKTYTFLGVPYAQAGRFEEPQPVDAWDGILDAQSYGTICPVPDQTALGTDEKFWPHRYWIQNENCQNLNIWTQSTDSTAKKPVLVFFHGGGHTNGSSIESVSYDGTNLSEYGDVVVITVNHRLNVLGYLDLSAYGNKYAPTANLGDADLIAALQWIHDNIETFGGDPENVTISGQSGGVGKVQSMMHAPAAEGLFQKAVMNSGGFTLSDKETNQMVAARTLKKLGIDENNIDEIKTVDIHDLEQAAADSLAELTEELGTRVTWNPSADGEIIEENFCDWTKNVNVMVGSVFAEQNHSWEVDGGNFNSWTEEEIDSNLTERYGDAADKIAEEFSKIFPEKKVQDSYFYAAANRTRSIQNADNLLANGNTVYEFLFNYEFPVDGGILAFHCSDLTFFSHNVELPLNVIATGANDDARRIQEQMAGALVTFMNTGSPSQKDLVWDPYTEDNKGVMVFDVESGERVLNDEQLCQDITDALAAQEAK